MHPTTAERPWIQALTELGFTGLEAEVYGALASASPATGYRLAQAVGKPVANVYKALQSLQAKGAIAIDDGETRQVRAVPPDELLRQLGRQFDRRRERAAEALARLPAPDADLRVYHLHSPELVFERARTMLARAERIALLDLGAAPLAELRADLERAAARGVVVALRTEAPAAIDGVDVVAIPARAAASAEPWPADWLTLVADGREHLLALFTPDGRDVHQAVWTESAFLAWVFHSGLAAEIARDAALHLLDAGGTPAEIRDSFARHDRLSTAEAPGRRMLLRTLERRPTDPPEEEIP